MKQDDIEKILQQYGTDRRQQQQLSDSLHRMARRQKQRVLWACSVVLVAASVWTLHRLAPLQQAEEIVVAQQDVHTEPQSTEQRPVQQETNNPHHRNPRPSFKFSPSPLPLTKLTIQEDSVPYKNEVQEHSLIETEQLAEKKDNHKSDDPTLKEPSIIDMNTTGNPPILLADNPDITLSLNENNHFWFKASIGASAFPKINTGYADSPIEFNNLTGIDGGETHFQITPIATFAANIGICYSIPMGGQQGLDLGIGLSGYSHQSEMTTYSATGGSSIDGTSTIIAKDPDFFYIFSLYANLPMTFNFKSRNLKDIGWNLSITPSHSLVSTKAMGILATGGPILNPWRLTMGIGITFPRGLFRRISLTANLLSLYTTSSHHEIGIEFGF